MIGPGEDAEDIDTRVKHALDRLERGGHANNLMIRALAVVVGFELALGIVLTVVAWETLQVANTAQEAARSQRSQCLATNEARAAQVRLWDYILDTPPSTPRTPEQSKQVAQFRDYVHRSFAQRECG